MHAVAQICTIKMQPIQLQGELKREGDIQRFASLPFTHLAIQAPSILTRLPTPSFTYIYIHYCRVG